jgi:hypothetical protein
VSDPIEQAVLMKVLQRAIEMNEDAERRFMENLSISVQNGVARAFSG